MSNILQNINIRTASKMCHAFALILQILNYVLQMSQQCNKTGVKKFLHQQLKGFDGHLNRLIY